MMQIKRLFNQKRMGISLGSLVVVSLVLGVLLINFVRLPTSDNTPPIIEDILTVQIVPEVEASCTVVLNGRPYFQEDDDEVEELTLIITLPDGTPLEGVCLTFTRDRGVGEEPEIIGSCTTDADGRCTILSPGGVINVLFGNTKIGGIPVNNSTDTLVATGDATTGGVSYYFPGDEPADENIVANPAEDGSGISMEHAEEDGDGLHPLPPGPSLPDGVVWGDWDITVDYPGGFVPPWLFPSGTPFNLELPTGIVAVNFVPFILHTSQAYGKAYCYYNTGESGYVRVPAQVGSFLPGGGTYFDLGAVLNGNARPKLVLEAEKDEFKIDMECWGWQGDELLQIGTETTAQESTLWIGQPLLMESGGFALEYALIWDGPEVEPVNPRLTGYSGTDVVPIDDDSELTVAANQTRFSSNLIAPSEVVSEDEAIKWEYTGAEKIGGFRIYRNSYLIGTAPPNARAWEGDGLALLECGQPTEIVMTTYLAGQESVPSTPTRIETSNCAAQLTVNIESIEIRNLQDCDGDACASAAEAYGYLAVNDVIIYFGGNSSDPYSVGIQDATTYPMSSLLAPFGKSNIVNVGLGDTDILNIEVVLFDRDFNTTDDLICSLQEILPARDADGWASQDGRRITRSAVYSEADCDVTIKLSVQQ